MPKTKPLPDFKAFADPRRLRILALLMAGERCACELLEDLDIAQPTLSYHMGLLVDAKIVKARKAGKWTHYCIAPPGLLPYLAFLKDLSHASDHPVNGKEHA